MARSSQPAIATAQPAAVAAPALTASEPAPTPDARLSHINGTPVPVGDHHQYYYDFKRWNLSTNPVGWMLGSFGVSGSYALSSHLVVRADLNYYAPLDTDIRGAEVGVGAPIYFRRAYEGVFLEPGVIARSFTVEDEQFGDEHLTEAGPQMLVGWHWSWDGGLNVALAGGVGRDLTDDGDVFGNGYLRFGYAF